jgi:hypothetical protein
MPEPRILKRGGPASRKLWVTADNGIFGSLDGLLEVGVSRFMEEQPKVWLPAGLRTSLLEEGATHRNWYLVDGSWDRDKFGGVKPIGLGPSFVRGFSPSTPTEQLPGAWKVCLEKPQGVVGYLHWRVVTEPPFTGVALDAAKESSPEGIQGLADTLHELALQQVELGTRARHLANQGKAAEALQAAQDRVAFVPGSVQVNPDQLAAVSDVAQAAGFLRHDDTQPRGNSLAAGRSRSFTAFLRAAVALRFSNIQLAEQMRAGEA